MHTSTCSEIALIDDSSIASGLSLPTICIKPDQKLSQSYTERPSKIAKWNFSKSTVTSGIKQRQIERSSIKSNLSNKSCENLSNENNMSIVSPDGSNSLQLICEVSSTNPQTIENRMERLNLKEKNK